ncbi:MAG: ATP-binding protein [Spirochaetaceae bacterium]
MAKNARRGSAKFGTTGKLKISNHWNAISIIALSRTNPLKAIAEFVENSIDAHATEITLIRGKEKGTYYLKVIDNGQGIDDFKYVATHVADSIKRKLKKEGETGIQGEFGIGLLSFWTVGEELTITSAGSDGVTRRMKLVRDNPGYSIREDNRLLTSGGTELLIKPVLAGVRQLTGEKIQNYLASELRERINRNKVLIKIVDKTARKELIVEPHKFSGRLLHHLPRLNSPMGEIYHELYLNEPSPENRVGLYKNGTRVLPSLSRIDQFACEPWTSGYLTGIIDASFLQLTPGTRDGIIYDNAFESFTASLEPLAAALSEIIEEQKRAEEEKASHRILNRISKALREALSYLPEEEYGWLDVGGSRSSSGKGDGDEQGSGTGGSGKRSAGDTVKTVYLPDGEAQQGEEETTEPVYVAESATEEAEESSQKEFFDYPGPLFKASISPAKAVVPVGESKRFSVSVKDKKGVRLDSGFTVAWEITDGEGEIDEPARRYIEFTAPEEPCITSLGCIVTQGETEVLCEALVTVTAEFGEHTAGGGAREGQRKGLPGYTYRRAPGELWRSRYDAERYIIIINKGHADFIYASKQKSRKLKYIAKLFAKELVLANFPEASREQVLERMIELQLYTEENL